MWETGNSILRLLSFPTCCCFLTAVIFTWETGNSISRLLSFPTCCCSNSAARWSIARLACCCCWWWWCCCCWYWCCCCWCCCCWCSQAVREACWAAATLSCITPWGHHHHHRHGSSHHGSLQKQIPQMCHLVIPEPPQPPSLLLCPSPPPPTHTQMTKFLHCTDIPTGTLNVTACLNLTVRFCAACSRLALFFDVKLIQHLGTRPAYSFNCSTETK